MKYSNACLRLCVVILQDLHCLQRLYHNIDHWLYYKMYIIYRDFITMLIIALPSHQFPHLMELLLVKYSNACLRLYVVILQDLHCLQRLYHNIDHWCITLYHRTNFQIFC